MFARCWSSHEASPFVSDTQSGVALWTLQEDDGEQYRQTLFSPLMLKCGEKKQTQSFILYFLKFSLLFFRCLNRTKRLSTTCVGSTLKTTSTSCRRSAPTTCRASPRASTPSTSETTGEYSSFFLIKKQNNNISFLVSRTFELLFFLPWNISEHHENILSVPFRSQSCVSGSFWVLLKIHWSLFTGSNTAQPQGNTHTHKMQCWKSVICAFKRHRNMLCFPDPLHGLMNVFI